MKEAGELHAIFQKFFPRRKRKTDIALLPRKIQTLPLEKKKACAIDYLNKASSLLSEGNLTAVPYFEATIKLDANTPQIWHQIGAAFFSYGCLKEHEKALLLASKCFKIATGLDAALFEAWLYWGKALFQLGNIFGECHYFLEAKGKLQEALSLCEKEPKADLAQNYWDLGLVWTHIAEHSGEAVDVRMAVQSFRNSLPHQKSPTPEFWNDFGNAYLQMGLLINDNRLYLQAAENFKKAINEDRQFYLGWSSLAAAYTQLYINTALEQYFSDANDCFAKAVQINPNDEDIWVRWAQLLGESGRINKDPKKLKLAIEKCVKVYAFASSPVKILGQWVESLSLLGAYTGNLDAIVEAEDKILKATDQFPDDPDLCYAYGICLSAYAIYYEDPNFYDLAIERLQHGLSLDRTNAELWHALGSFHSQIGWMIDDPEPIKRSTKFFTRAIDLKPCCPTLIFDQALALLKLADLTNNLQTLESAIKNFESILQAQKDSLLHHPEWLFYYAYALDILGDHTEEENHYIRAIEVLSQVLLIDPDYPQIHFKIGLTFSHLGELTGEADFFHRAINYFRLAAKEDEENEEIWLEWGLTLINLALDGFDSQLGSQLYLEAEQKIVRSGQLGNQHAYYHLACLYSLTSRLPEAMTLIEKAAKQGVLPLLDEMMQDEWLEALRATENFSHFLAHWESKQNAPDDVL